MSTVALIAHDAQKPTLVAWVREHRHILARCKLMATAHTARLLCEEGLAVKQFAAGPYGGDQQIGAEIVQGRVDLLVFLRDPLTPQPHEPDISALLRVCDVHNILVATNERTAHVLVQALAKEERHDG